MSPAALPAPPTAASPAAAATGAASLGLGGLGLGSLRLGEGLLLALGGGTCGLFGLVGTGLGLGNPTFGFPDPGGRFLGLALGVGDPSLDLIEVLLGLGGPRSELLGATLSVRHSGLSILDEARRPVGLGLDVGERATQAVEPGLQTVELGPSAADRLRHAGVLGLGLTQLRLRLGQPALDLLGGPSVHERCAMVGASDTDIPRPARQSASCCL